MPACGGHQLMTAGNCACGVNPIYPGITIVNALPENHRVELQGMNDRLGIRDAKVSRTFDVNNACKPSAEQGRYRFCIITGPDSTEHNDSEHAHLGSFIVIHKTYNGPIAAYRAGYIDTAYAKAVGSKPNRHRQDRSQDRPCRRAGFGETL